MDRMILHSDINACYASIELLRHPELRGRPVAVGGERELRHGVILAKDQMARAAGVRTGMTLWAARQQCPELTILPPDFDLYYDYSRRVREIYAGFTDRCEPFGMDECWLDMTGCVGHEDALRTAVSLGGDCDTLTDITCAIAWPFYLRSGLDSTMVRLRDEALALLHDDLREIVIRWEERYGGYTTTVNSKAD